LEKKIKEKNEKESNFEKFEQVIKQNLEESQKQNKASFLQKIHK
jgi:hypothetical protein